MLFIVFSGEFDQTLPLFCEAAGCSQDQTCPAITGYCQGRERNMLPTGVETTSDYFDEADFPGEISQTTRKSRSKFALAHRLR